MALDSSLRHSGVPAAQQDHGDQTGDLSWTQSSLTVDTHHHAFATRSVTLWDEVPPVSRALPGSFDDPPKR